jgi:hypothetical protein
MTERQLMFKTLDNPTRLLFWTIDEFLVMATPILWDCVSEASS